MEAFLHQVFSGLANGAIYASLALAIVMIYQSTHHINFAQGEMAMFSTFVGFSLLGHMDFWPAFFLALAISALAGASLERVVMRPVESAPVLNSVIVTIGLFTAFNSLALWRWGGVPRPFPSPAVFSGAPLEMGAITISRLNIGIFCMSLAIMLMLFAFLNFTKVGLAMRAAAENPTQALTFFGMP